MALFQNLFTPFKIGKLELKNRVVMPPMATNFADLEGTVNERHIAYYRRRARGGAGLIIFEHTGIAKQGKAFPNMALIDSDAKISQFKKLVQAVHGEGGKFFIQVNHAGRQTLSAYTGCPTVAPSPIPCPVRQEMPKALSREEILRTHPGLRGCLRKGEGSGGRRRGNPHGPWIPAESISLSLFQPEGR